MTTTRNQRTEACEILSAQFASSEYDVHETCFVEVQATGGFITLVTHNEHNGYYGGFDPVIEDMAGQGAIGYDG
jgi:hypothetical protein